MIVVNTRLFNIYQIMSYIFVLSVVCQHKKRLGIPPFLEIKIHVVFCYYKSLWYKYGHQFLQITKLLAIKIDCNVKVKEYFINL